MEILANIVTMEEIIIYSNEVPIGHCFSKHTLLNVQKEQSLVSYVPDSEAVQGNFPDPSTNDKTLNLVEKDEETVVCGLNAEILENDSADKEVHMVIQGKEVAFMIAINEAHRFDPLWIFHENFVVNFLNDKMMLSLTGKVPFWAPLKAMQQV